MRKLLFILFFLITPITLSAQQMVYEGRWHEDILTIRWGGIRHYDQYLSPLLYKGQFLALQNEWWQQLKPDTDWQHVGKIKLQGARTFNPAYTNMIYAIGIQCGWGTHFDFGKMIGLHGLSLFAGPYFDADLFTKELINNVNKPFSIDGAIELKANAGISYSFSARTTSYRLRYIINFGIIGVQFVPEYGQSYYELGEGIIDRVVGLSGFHNKLDMRHELTIDLQFKHSAWRIGVEHEYQYNNMNLLSFQREQVSLVIGTVFNYKTGIKQL